MSIFDLVDKLPEAVEDDRPVIYKKCFDREHFDESLSYTDDRLQLLKSKYKLDDNFVIRNIKTNRAIGTKDISSGYVKICVYLDKNNRTTYMYHQLVFALYHGQFAMCIIDHMDGNRSNNHPSNLIPSTFSKNSYNSVREEPARFGCRRIHYSKHASRYVVTSVNGKMVNLADLREAQVLALTAVKKLHTNRVYDVQLTNTIAYCKTNNLSLDHLNKFI